MLGGDATTVTMELDCLARTLPPAMATGVGPAAHRAGIFDGPRQHYRVCGQSDALSESGAGFFQAPLICSS